jgi:hypothetical protein
MLALILAAFLAAPPVRAGDVTVKLKIVFPPAVPIGWINTVQLKRIKTRRATSATAWNAGIQALSATFTVPAGFVYAVNAGDSLKHRFIGRLDLRNPKKPEISRVLKAGRAKSVRNRGAVY